MGRTTESQYAGSDSGAVLSPDLRGQVALVTGAGRGIGRAIALALGAAGAHVIVAARSAAQLADVAATIAGVGGQASAIPVDISQEESVEALFRQIRKRFGRLDVLIANAAVILTGELVDFPVDDFDALMAINLRGTFLCCQQAMKIMVPQHSGYIIALASVASFKTYHSQTAYAATKHGLLGMVKGLALESQEHGIRVSAILPGGVDTDMGRAARPDLDTTVLLQPDDIARTVLFLLSLSDQAAIDQIYIRRRASQPFP